MVKIDKELYILAAWPTVDIKEANETAKIWKNMGYRTAVLFEGEYYKANHIDYMITLTEWHGFPYAANILCGLSFDIIVIAGNDMYPDAEHPAHEIGREFVNHFHGTNGVMQPTGDNYGCIDIAAVSPWIGSDYVRCMDGKPYCEDYYHYYCDADLQTVATKKGKFWQRPDLSQYHDHWSRKTDKRPIHLQPALKHHPIDKATYVKKHGSIV